MAKVLTDSQNYTNIANAIRLKAGSSARYKPSEMAVAIENISGGIPCTLTVITSPNATVTATLDETTLTATADNSGTATFVIEKEGVWTVSATDGNSTNTEQVNTAYTISLDLSLVGTLEETSWDMISKMSKLGLASRYWKIGDTKTITCNTNAMTVQIIGFDHDDVTDSAAYGRSKAGITFQTVECYPAKYPFNNKTSVPWKTSYARTDRLPYFLTGGGVYEGLGEIQNYVVSVNKKAKASVTNVNSIEVVGDSLFLLSLKEIFDYGANGEEGTQYAYYSAGNSKVKKLNGTNSSWWTRSASDANYYYCVYEDGQSTTGKYSSSYGYAFAFCI